MEPLSLGAAALVKWSRAWSGHKWKASRGIRFAGLPSPLLLTTEVARRALSVTMRRVSYTLPATLASTVPSTPAKLKEVPKTCANSWEFTGDTGYEERRDIIPCRIERLGRSGRGGRSTQCYWESEWVLHLGQRLWPSRLRSGRA